MMQIQLEMKSFLAFIELWMMLLAGNILPSFYFYLRYSVNV